MMTKICTKCKKDKPLSDFHKMRDGLRSQCKSCRNEYLKQWGKDNPEKKREQKYKHRYGISLEEYDLMLRKQDGVCAICKCRCSSKKMLSVDHDHASGLVRGLLCHNCNAAIGHLKDSVEMLESAIAYLNRGSGG